MIPATYDFSVRSLRNRRLLAGTLLTALAVYWGFAVRDYMAYRAAAQLDLPHLERAVRLEPGNSEYWHLLGRYYLLADQDAEKSVRSLQHAVELNPFVARQWLDLASAYSLLSDFGRRTDALDHAAAADPMMPSVAWDVAVNYIVEGRNEQAWPHLRVAIANDPARRGEAFSMALRAGANVDTILRHLMPSDPASNLAFVGFLTSHERTADSIQAWDWFARTHQPVDSHEVYPFIQFLLSQHEPAAAYRVWSDLAASDAALGSYLHDDGNLIVNGGFENPILNAGFDWRLVTSSHVTVAVDTTVFHAGTRCVSATFDGKSNAFTGLHQFVVVEPGARYRLSGYMRGEAVDGAERPRFVVTDPFNYRIYAVTDDVAEGSSSWRKFEVEFDAPPEVKEVIVSVASNGSQSLVKGTVWIDDAALVKLP